VVHPDGTGRHAIQLHTDPGSSVAFQPEWSPDGKRIVCLLHLASTGQEDIFTVRADGTDLRQVTKTPDKDRWATKCMNMSLVAAKLIMRPERATEEQFDPCLAQTDCRYDEAHQLESGPVPLQWCSTSASRSAKSRR